MTALWRRLASRSVIPTAMGTQVGYVVSQTWDVPGSERIGTDYLAYVEGAYKANAIVFGIVNARLRPFSDATFKFRNLADKSLFGTEALRLLEEPWPNGTTGELLARMLQDVDITGNAFVRRRGDVLERLRPDWVTIVSREVDEGFGVTRELVGYAYMVNGRPGDVVLLSVDEVAHWSPIPDPVAEWRGMSWFASAVTDINNDAAISTHQERYFSHAASPNLLIKYPQKMDADSLGRLSGRLAARHGGVDNAWKTLILDAGADVSVIGQPVGDWMTGLRNAGETRLCAAAGVPPIVAYIQSGLDASTYTNHPSAWKAFISGTVHHLWRTVAAALQKFVDAPPGAELWFDTRDIPSLAESEQDRQTANVSFATAAASLVMQGWEPASVQSALIASDMSLLKHTGALSVQLYQGGQAPDGGTAEPADDQPDEGDLPDEETSA